jgi:sugar/nucleoside kinase (ribokinase family)
LKNREKQIDVYGIGHAIVDIQVKVRDCFIEDNKLKKGSMSLVSEMEQQSFINSLGNIGFNQASGGSAANSIIALSQLGGKAAFCGLVADDSFGRFYYDEMKSLGIVYCNTPLEDKKTGTCLIFISPDAERTMNSCLGVSAELKPHHLDLNLIQSSKWLYIEGYVISSPNGPDTIKSAIQHAKKNNVKIALSCSDSFIVENYSDLVREVLKESHLCFANETEARKLSGGQDFQDIISRFKSLTNNFVITRGEKGAYVAFEQQEIAFEAKKTQAIDTTGAGDMFAGTFLFGLTHDMSLLKTGQLACTLSSEVVSQLGPRLKIIPQICL